MNIRQYGIFGIAMTGLLALPPITLAQDDDSSGADAAGDKQATVIHSEVTLGLYYLDDPSYRFGKYTGLTDDGAEALIDFRIEKRPEWDSGDPIRWSLQGWRLGLDSRRLEFDFNDLGTQKFNAHYREIPNNRFSDGMTPYRNVGSADLTLADSWEIVPGSSNTTGFIALDQSLADLKIDTQRRRLDLSYERKLGMGWSVDIDYRHETKKGERTIGAIFGYTGGNPRAVILPAPVDWTTDTFEAMFNYGNSRLQFGFGLYGSWFGNDETSLVWQNAYGRQSGWDESVTFPDAQGRLALEPDNSFLQFKAYGGVNIGSASRLTADVAFGQMEQDDPFLPYTINPNLIVNTPVPLDNLDGKIDTTLINVRLTTQLFRRMSLAANYRYDDRDNKTPQAIYPYIGGDSQDQRPFEDGRINLPYSYRKETMDATVTYRLAGNTRIKGGVEYSDYHRDYSEVAKSDEFAWVAGVHFGMFETASLRFDYRDSSRDVDAYVGNRPYIESHVPGTTSEEEFENHPLLRKYFLTDRDREEFRFRADFFPVPEVNFGVATNWFEDDYGDGYFGLNKAEIEAYTLDFGWYPVANVALTGFYTRETYDAEQSSLSFSNPGQAEDLTRIWFADTSDDVDTWNLSVAFSDIGSGSGWNGFDFGFDYTFSDTESKIDVTAVTFTTEPLPELRSELRSISGWAMIDVGERSSIRLAIENQRLETDDFGLDNVVPDTLTNVLLLGESAANYDIILVTGSFTYRF